MTAAEEDAPVGLGPPSRVEPRLRERRIAVAREVGRRRLRRLLVVAAVLGLALVLLGLTWTPLLDVEEVVVEGAARTTARSVREATGVAVGDPLAWFDTAEAEARVEALPWVGTAEVAREWSGRVTVVVVEREAVAALATADGAWVVADAGGRVLARREGPPEDLAVVDGVTTTAGPGDRLDEEVEGALVVAGAVPPVLAPRVAALRLAEGDVALDLREGGVVLLGGPDDAPAKLAAAAAVLAAVPAGCVERLDVSLASAPALVRAPGC